jgi:type IV fimbrial biogenesis protein FimT
MVPEIENMTSTMCRRERGFTLLELMTALAVAAVLITVGVPQLRDLTIRQRITGAAQDLHIDLALARNEAVTRATNVTVCPSNDLATCTNDGWGNGRLIFIDANANGVVDVGELVVKQAQPLTTGLTATPAAGFVTFNSRGQTAALTIGICQSGYVGRNIDIKTTGHASVVTPAVNCP